MLKPKETPKHYPAILIAILKERPHDYVQKQIAKMKTIVTKHNAKYLRDDFMHWSGELCCEIEVTSEKQIQALSTEIETSFGKKEFEHFETITIDRKQCEYKR